MELRLRITPGAKVSAWAGAMPDGRRKVKVAAPAIEGRANAALVAFVAKSLGLPKRAVQVAQGASGRDKVLTVDLAADELARRIEACMKPKETG